jgi:hypothetical protein
MRTMERQDTICNNTLLVTSINRSNKFDIYLISQVKALIDDDNISCTQIDAIRNGIDECREQHQQQMNREPVMTNMDANTLRSTLHIKDKE